MKPRRKFPTELKRQVVEEVRNGLISLAEILRKYEIVSSVYYRWEAQYERGKFDNEPTHEGELLNRIAELERKVGQQSMEIDLLKKIRALQQKKISVLPSNVVVAGPSKRGAK